MNRGAARYAKMSSSCQTSHIKSFCYVLSYVVATFRRLQWASQTNTQSTNDAGFARACRGASRIIMHWATARYGLAKILYHLVQQCNSALNQDV